MKYIPLSAPLGALAAPLNRSAHHPSVSSGMPCSRADH